MANGRKQRAIQDGVVSIIILCILLVLVPIVGLFVMRLLFMGGPIFLIGGIVIFIASYLEGRND